MRQAIVDPGAPAVWDIVDASWLLVSLGIVVVTCALGWWVFQREAPRIAENL
jgi:hypothetical protein